MHLASKWGPGAVLVAVTAIAIWPRIAAAQGGTAVRVLNDAAIGDRWMLERDPDHPGDPGRLVRVEGGAQKTAPVQGARVAATVVIHAGDRVVVEEKTATVEARLEGVALGAAASGRMLTVRLAVGGKVVYATATASGHARLGMEARR